MVLDISEVLQETTNESKSKVSSKEARSQKDLSENPEKRVFHLQDFSDALPKQTKGKK